jgi:hypothetical protein
MADSSNSADPPRPVIPATRARQGRYGRHVFWVLVISTLLAAIGLFLAWTWRAQSLTAADTKIANDPLQTQSTFSAPEPAPVTVQKGADHTTPQAP